jgi:hypothetical protein
MPQRRTALDVDFAARFDFDGPRLVTAREKTFKQRKTAMP